jgi:hypothetical protein
MVYKRELRAMADAKSKKLLIAMGGSERALRSVSTRGKTASWQDRAAPAEVPQHIAFGRFQPRQSPDYHVLWFIVSMLFQ